jgi:hypothetical protein
MSSSAHDLLKKFCAPTLAARKAVAAATREGVVEILLTD